MAIPKMTDDVSIISVLGDNPNTDNGLSAEALKAKFDEAALLIKAYLNSKLVPAVATVETQTGNAVKSIGDVAANLESVSDVANTAHQAAEMAQTTANEAKEAALSAGGMKREFSSGAISANSYTTPGVLSKFYHVLVNDDGTITPLTVDWRAVHDLGELVITYITYSRTEGAYLYRSLTVKMNSDSTVTFTADTGAIIQHVCGYY